MTFYFTYVFPSYYIVFFVTACLLDAFFWIAFWILFIFLMAAVVSLFTCFFGSYGFGWSVIWGWITVGGCCWGGVWTVFTGGNGVSVICVMTVDF